MGVFLSHKAARPGMARRGSDGHGRARNGWDRHGKAMNGKAWVFFRTNWQGVPRIGMASQGVARQGMGVFS